MKIVAVVGARPQFIKAAVASRAIREMGVSEILVHTGQHYDNNMSAIFFRELEIPTPDYHLGIGGGTHGQNTGRMLEAIERVLLEEKPNWVLVYGDTDSTLAGALAAAKIHIPVAHVEAGLRSFNQRMPEEINRVLTDHVSSLLFAPTKLAVENLYREGVPPEKIQFVGDVMFDAALFYQEEAKTGSHILEHLSIKAKSFILVTVHRAENTNEARLRAILTGLVEIASEILVVWPLHPRTRKALEELNLLQSARDALTIIEPVGYLDMVMLESSARLIVTDSGGVQKEAFFYHTPCITLREETEWVELVELGWNMLCPPTDASSIAAAIRVGIDIRGQEAFPYGNGTSGIQIAQALMKL